jgi:hypothetical protein
MSTNCEAPHKKRTKIFKNKLVEKQRQRKTEHSNLIFSDFSPVRTFLFLKVFECICILEKCNKTKTIEFKIYSRLTINIKRCSINTVFGNGCIWNSLTLREHSITFAVGSTAFFNLIIYILCLEELLSKKIQSQRSKGRWIQNG